MYGSRLKSTELKNRFQRDSALTGVEVSLHVQGHNTNMSSKSKLDDIFMLTRTNLSFLRNFYLKLVWQESFFPISTLNNQKSIPINWTQFASRLSWMISLHLNLGPVKVYQRIKSESKRIYFCLGTSSKKNESTEEKKSVKQSSGNLLRSTFLESKP